MGYNSFFNHKLVGFNLEYVFMYVNFHFYPIQIKRLLRFASCRKVTLNIRWYRFSCSSFSLSRPRTIDQRFPCNFSWQEASMVAWRDEVIYNIYSTICLCTGSPWVLAASGKRTFVHSDNRLLAWSTLDFWFFIYIPEYLLILGHLDGFQYLLLHWVLTLHLQYLKSPCQHGTVISWKMATWSPGKTVQFGTRGPKFTT